MQAGAIHHDTRSEEWAVRPALEAVVRTLAVAAAAGALVGVLIGGVGGRLAMALLARLNPEDAGRVTDDGFSIGQFTAVGTLNLLVAAVFLGLVGALLYLVLRPLAFGPHGVRVVTLTFAGTVVGGAFVINPTGRDFRLLDPSWLLVLLFLAIPALFVPLVSVLVERWLTPGSWFRTAPVRHVAPVLVVWVCAGILLPLLPVAVGVGLVHQRLSVSLGAGARSGLVWAGRLLVAALGVLILAATVRAVAMVT